MIYKISLPLLAIALAAEGVVYYHVSDATPTLQPPVVQITKVDYPSEKMVSDEVVVAVIDTGADINHPSLKNYIWTNPGESGFDKFGRNKATNGVDDDGNGFIDDVHGWNFVDNNNLVTDEHGHGTHVAGLITSQLHGSKNVKLMILKYFDNKSSPLNILHSSNRALAYALGKDATIINYSGGGDLPNIEEKNLYRKALAQNILVVAAAGNESRSNDFVGFYPASYGFENIISVSSVDSDSQVLSSSNYGVHSVDLAAPGKELVSALPGGRFGRLTGTSQATALVSGMAAHLKSRYKNIHAFSDLKSRLLATSNLRSTLAYKMKHPRTPDLDRALAMKSKEDLTPELRFAAKSRVAEVFDDPTRTPEVSRNRMPSSRP